MGKFAVLYYDSDGQLRFEAFRYEEDAKYYAMAIVDGPWDVVEVKVEGFNPSDNTVDSVWGLNA